METNDNNRYLIIGDVHQNIEWAESVIESHKGDFDHIIFLGDFFDTFRKDLASAKETCEFMIRMYNRGDTTFIVGNHDVAYYELWYKLKKDRSPKKLLFPCSGVTLNKASKIEKYLPEEIIVNSKLGMFVHNYFISHAGITEDLLTLHYSEDDTSEKFQRFLNSLPTRWENFKNIPIDPVFYVSRSRGGLDDFAGLLWADWYKDFTDHLPFPQILGHTQTQKFHKPHDEIRNNEKAPSVNLDGGQDMFSKRAILSASGIQLFSN